jgi:hypothetical protein
MRQTYVRETAKQIAERIRNQTPPPRPTYVSAREPVEKASTISAIGGVW